VQDARADSKTGVSRRAAAIEVAVLLALAAAYAAAEALDVPKRWSIACIASGLLTFGVSVALRRKETWRDFGLRADNFLAAALPVGAWTAAAAGAIVFWTVVAGRAIWRPELAVLLPLYPLYGVVQQLVFQGLLHRRLLLLTNRRFVAAGLTTLAFALVHVFDLRLVGLTFVAGAVWAWLYQRHPNVWALGLSHGILASLTYPMLLSTNPLLRV